MQPAQVRRDRAPGSAQVLGLVLDLVLDLVRQVLGQVLGQARAGQRGPCTQGHAPRAMHNGPRAWADTPPTKAPWRPCPD